MIKGNKITIYDIAKEAETSTTTVSRVISGKGKFKPETVERINRVLRKYDFAPDYNAQGLVNGGSKLIGILTEDIRNQHLNSISHNIESQLRENGYCAVIMNTSNENYRIDTCIDILSKRKVEAIVLVGSLYENTAVRNSIVKHFAKGPVIMVNGKSDLSNVWSIIANEHNGIYRCVDLLKSTGKKHIAYIQKPSTASSLRKREGFIAKMLELGYKEENLNIIDCELDINDAYKNTIKLMKKSPETDGIIYSSDLLAFGGVDALLDLGKRIPEDVAVIGVNNSDYTEMSKPKITSLDTRMDILGKISAELVIDILNGKKPKPSTMVELEIAVKQTT